MGKTFNFHRINGGLYVAAHFHNPAHQGAEVVELRRFANTMVIDPEDEPSAKILLPRAAHDALPRSRFTFTR